MTRNISRRQRSTFTVVALTTVTAVVLALTGLVGTTAQADRPGGAKPVVAKTADGKMTSRVEGTTPDGRRVRGTFTPSKFSATDGGATVTGTLELIEQGKGKPVRSTREGVTMDVVGAQVGGVGGMGMAPAASCDILNLVLGPLDLNVLGLDIQLDQVVLDIVAQPGPGNLLGNLLCSVAGLLDGNGGLGGLVEGLLTDLVDLLNGVLGRLGL